MAVRLIGSKGSTSGVAQGTETTAAGAPAFALARALLTFGLVGYLAVVVPSSLGLAPLGDRLSACLLLAGTLLVSLLPLRGFVARGVTEAPRALMWAGWLAAGAGLLATLTSALLALLVPIGAYDALGYRLAAVAQWLDAGAVRWVSGDDPLRNGYPLGLEVIEALVYRAFDGPAAVDAVSTPFVLAGALALAGFARTLAAPRWAAELAAGLFLLVPMQLLNAPSGYADAAFAGVLVSLLVAGARWASASDARAFSTFDLGACAALVIALKPHGFALAASVLAVGLMGRARRTDLRRALSELGRAGIVACCGLFFAVRNVLVTGNPIYPLELRVGDRILLAGESSLDGILSPSFNVPPELAQLPAALRPLWVWLQPHGPAHRFDDRLAGFGYAFLLFGLPALGWALLRTLRRAEPRGLAYLVLTTLACFAIQPLAFWPRFTSWLWGAAALAFALLLAERARGGGRAATALALTALLLAIPEAVYALAHVKQLDTLGFSLLTQDRVTALARVSGVDAGFVRRALIGKRDVCRTPWRLGTDDANLDGIAAQLSPRPRMHVVDAQHWSTLAESVRAQGCDELIVIGDNPLVASAPPAWSRRIVAVTAFGPCHLVSLSSPEVTP